MTTRKIREQVQPPEFVEDYVMRLFYPQRALGKYVDEEMAESSLIISYLVVSMCIVFILSILLLDRNWSLTGKISSLTTAVMVISTVIFVSFIYAVFDATKLFHISLLIALVTIGGLLLKQMEESDIDKADKDMITAIIVFSALTLAILIYYWIISRTVTDATEYREKERRVRVENKYKDKIERVRKDYDILIKENREEKSILENELLEQTKRADDFEKKLEKITTAVTR